MSGNDVKKDEFLITKPTKHVKDVFAKWFGGVTFYEIIIFVCGFLLAAVFGILFYFTINNLIAKWCTIGAVVLLIVILTIWLMHTRKDKKKQWRHTLDVFHYSFKHDYKKIDSPIIFSMIGIESIADDGLITFQQKMGSDKSTSLKQTGGNLGEEYSNMMGVVFKMNGVNVSLLTNMESNIVVETMANPWLKLAVDHKIIVVDEPINVEAFNNHLRNIMKQYPDKGNSEEEIVKRQLMNYYEINEEIQNNSNIVNKGYYLVLFFNNTRDVENAKREFEGCSNGSKVTLEQIKDKKQVCTILNQLYCPNSTLKLFSPLSPIGVNRNLGQIRIEKDHFLLNNQYTKIIEIMQCPSVITAGWMKKAANYQNIQTNISFVRADTGIVSMNLERAKRKTKLNWDYIRTEGEQYNLIEYVDAMTELIHDYARGLSKAWYVNIQFIISAPTLEELKKNVADFTKELKSVDRFTFELLDYKQFDALASIFSFKVAERKKVLTFGEMSNNVIGAMYPFSSNALKDEKGLFLGYDSYSGDGFWFDLTKKEGYRNSNVCLVCAKTGGGKTYTVSKLINWFKATGEKNYFKQYIVDPLGDYNGFLKNYEGVDKIDMTDAKVGLINPLQILDEEMDRHTKAGEFTAFLKMVNNDQSFTAGEERRLEETLIELYEKHHITDKTKTITTDSGERKEIFLYGSLPNKSWPITDELYQLLESKSKTCKDKAKAEEYKNLSNVVWKLSKQGTYREVWNGHTTINTDKANIIIMDTSKLETINNPTLYRCQMFLISGFLRGEALKNRDRNIGITDPSKLKWINIVVDEAHRWIRKNPIAQKTLEILAREIRHHKGVLILSTQNISDFKGDAEGILKQALYHIVLNMTPADISSYDEFLKESGGLTQAEKDFIQTANTGEALISIGTRYRCYVTIVANEPESYMWMHGAK